MNLGLAAAGTALMFAGAILFRLLAPRAGRPESWWVATDMKAMLAALLVQVLVLCGAGMMARGLIV